MAAPMDWIGAVFVAECPFIQDVHHGFDENGPTTELSWRPGIEWESSGPEGEANMRAHGMGLVRYTVVSVHDLPAPYPDRVFFTRKWVDPTGREFGASKLHTMTVPTFRRRLKGYRPAGGEWGRPNVRPLTEDERAAKLGIPDLRPSPTETQP